MSRRPPKATRTDTLCPDTTLFRSEFEMTDRLTRPPNSQGMPDFSEQATKMQDQHRSMFMTDGAITADMGPALARSAEGEAAARNDLPSDEEAVKLAQEAQIGRAACRERVWQYV